MLRSLDSKVFPSEIPRKRTKLPTSPDSTAIASVKRRKVSDVQAEIDAQARAGSASSPSPYSHLPRSLFSTLTGLAAKRKRDQVEAGREQEIKMIGGDLKGKSKEQDE